MWHEKCLRCIPSAAPENAAMDDYCNNQGETTLQARRNCDYEVPGVCVLKDANCISLPQSTFIRMYQNVT